MPDTKELNFDEDNYNTIEKYNEEMEEMYSEENELDGFHFFLELSPQTEIKP